jgi:8-oxo-dGTP pyrophosphatase MutT (NUDIX family)
MAKTVAAGIFLVRKDGKLLVCHPTNHDPNFWSIPKGKVEDGEHFIDAAIRETYEETNITLSFARNIRPLEPVNYKHGKKILHPFVVFEFENLGLAWKSFEIKCNSNVPEDRGGFPEMDAYKWVSLEEAKTLLHSTQVACLDVIEKMLLENTNA